MKEGDRVWVLCEVAMVYKDRAAIYFDVRHGGAVFEAKASDLRTVEPPVIEACTKTANDQLRQSLMDYPFGEPEAIKEFLTTKPNCSEIPNSSSDPINPIHYKQGGIECIEAIKAALGDGFPDYLRGNVMKYLWRYKEKGGVDDLRKSAWYLDRLFKEVGE